jgi:hypothetical protein
MSIHRDSSSRAGFVSALFRVVIDEMSVFEVESMLLDVGLSLCLIPNEHDLIVATV